MDVEFEWLRSRMIRQTEQFLAQYLGEAAPAAGKSVRATPVWPRRTKRQGCPCPRRSRRHVPRRQRDEKRLSAGDPGVLVGSDHAG